jgi:hypothetical protein
MFDGVVEEVAVLRVFGDDNSKEGSYRASGGREGVVGFGWFVESDFLDPDEIPDVEAGDNFFDSSGRNGWCRGRVA